MLVRSVIEMTMLLLTLTLGSLARLLDMSDESWMDLSDYGAV